MFVRGKTKLQPTGDHVLVRRSAAQDKTPGGLLLPDQAKEKPKQGEVLAVGPGTRNKDGYFVAINLKAGDKVLFNAYAGDQVTDPNEPLDEGLLMMREADILATIVE